jgi:polyisoprenoid-binding protein YceI
MVKDVPRLGPTVAMCLAALTMVTGISHAQRHERTVPDAVLLAGTLSVVGHSTVGDFVGTTASVTGAVVGGTDLATARGWAEAPVATLRTGNARRDRDLRAALESDRYPTLRFDVTGVATSVRAATAPPTDSAGATLRGALAIHGVARDVEVPATLVRRADSVRVTSAFPLHLHDYRVGGLHKLFGLLRVRDEVQIRADLRFVLAAPPAAVAPRD